MCYKDKCKNGGTCQEDIPNHSFTCACPSGYVGDYCESGALSYYSILHTQNPRCGRIGFGENVVVKDLKLKDEDKDK